MTRIVVSVMLLGLVAHASPVDDARQHYQAGTAAFNLGDFPKAVIEYKAAYTAKQDPTFLYNIAQAARLAGDRSVCRCDSNQSCLGSWISRRIKELN